jgi:hypothetical protein
MNDFVPKSDADFNNWQSELISNVAVNAGKWGIPVDDLTKLQDKQANWIAVFAKSANRQNRTQADVQEKNETRYDFEKTTRDFIKEWLASNSRITDADRVRMGLTVRSGSRTSASVPVSCPVATIDFSVRLQHTIHFADEAGGRSKAKPEGVHGCEIYMKLDGEAPKDISDMVYVATDTATPYTLNFDVDKAGKPVYYRLRWVNTRGQAGPWSAIVSAVVPG